MTLLLCPDTVTESNRLCNNVTYTDFPCYNPSRVRGPMQRKDQERTAAAAAGHFSSKKLTSTRAKTSREASDRQVMDNANLNSPLAPREKSMAKLVCIRRRILVARSCDATAVHPLTADQGSGVKKK